MLNIFTIIAIAQTTGAFTDIPKDYLLVKGKPTTVLAKVDGVPIMQSAVDDLVWDWQSKVILNELIEYQLIRNEAKKESVTVSVQEVRAATQNAISKYAKSLPAGTNVDQEMRKQGFTKSRVYLSWQAKLLTERLLLRKFDAKEFVKVSTIIIRVDSAQATDVEKASKKATEAYDALVKGKPWKEVLQANVTEPSIVETEGALGWRLASILPKEVAGEVVKLKVGGITKPIQTQYGFQIFRVDAQGKDASPIDIVGLKEQYIANGQKSLMDTLRQKAKIVRYRSAFYRSKASPEICRRGFVVCQPTS